MKHLPLYPILAIALAAQTSAPQKSAETKPVPEALKAEYYRTHDAVATLAPVWAEKNADNQKAGAAIAAFCGDKFTPRQTEKDIDCVAKPEPTTPPGTPPVK